MSNINPGVFQKRGLLKHSAELTGKQLKTTACRSLF